MLQDPQRFSPCVRKMWERASLEARQREQSAVTPEYLLLCLLDDKESVATGILQSLGAEPKAMQDELQALLGHSNREQSGKMGFESEAQKVISIAADEAHQMNHPYIGSEHLLLGLLHNNSEDSVDQIFRMFGVNLDTTRKRVEVVSKLYVSENASTTEPEEIKLAKQPYNGKLTLRARSVLKLSQQEAMRFSHTYISTEHILLGLLRENSGVGVHALRSLNVDVAHIQISLENALLSEYYKVLTPLKPGLTEEGKKVIEHAVGEALSFGHNYVGTEHLLLGLFGVRDGMAAKFLRALDVEAEPVVTQ